MKCIATSSWEICNLWKTCPLINVLEYQKTVLKSMSYAHVEVMSYNMYNLKLFQNLTFLTITSNLSTNDLLFFSLNSLRKRNGENEDARTLLKCIVKCRREEMLKLLKPTETPRHYHFATKLSTEMSMSRVPFPTCISVHTLDRHKNGSLYMCVLVYSIKNTIHVQPLKNYRRIPSYVLALYFSMFATSDFMQRI